MNKLDKEQTKLKKYSKKIIGKIIKLDKKHLIPILEIIMYSRQNESINSKFDIKLFGFNLTCISLIIIENKQEYLIEVQEKGTISQYKDEIPNLTSVINKIKQV